ncbi:MAG TPA: hypothetical protein VMY36_04495 [Patescibacteria group bacterium]|nr:hypothetical protein [Patescibacteria group bacterium]
MKLKIVFFVSFLFGLAFLLPASVFAWAGGTHAYLCPPMTGLNCNIADDVHFKETYPLGEVNHLCLDNKPDCPPRLMAKYYLKKYYFEGEKDINLLGAAAHLYQDSFCPEHWYPMREFFGRPIAFFSPDWVGRIEGLVDQNLSQGNKDWDLTLNHQGKTLVVDQLYLDNLKEEMTDFLNQEPVESLTELESQIKIKNFFSLVRGLREILLPVLVLISLVLIYSFWQWQKNKKGKSDLIIVGLILGILLFVFVLGFFY